MPVENSMAILAYSESLFHSILNKELHKIHKINIKINISEIKSIISNGNIVNNIQLNEQNVKERNNFKFTI